MCVYVVCVCARVRLCMYGIWVYADHMHQAQVEKGFEVLQEIGKELKKSKSSPSVFVDLSGVL